MKPLTCGTCRFVWAPTNFEEENHCPKCLSSNVTIFARPEPPAGSAAEHYEEVHHPQHYGGDVVYETIKVIAAWDLGFVLGTVVKHISRAGKKPGQAQLKDLKKAAWYLNWQIEQIEKESN